MEEVSSDTPPFWPPPSAAHRRCSPSSPLLPAPMLIILFPMIGLIVIFLVVPTLLSAAQHIFRPNSVKKSWDSVNILLVSFAILCGVSARRKDDGSAPSGDGVTDDAASVAVKGTLEFEAPSYGGEVAVTGVGRLKRNSSSYPDLRQNLMCETGDYRFRFFDDFEINKFRSSAINSHFKIEKTDEVKEIPVDTFVLRTTTTPPPPPPPPPFVAGLKPRRTYATISRTEKAEKVISQHAATAQPPTPPPPPPSPLMRVKLQAEIRSGKFERRKSNAAKEIKMALASIYSAQRKRKRKQRTQNQGEIVTEIGRRFSNVPPPSPPPSMFHNLFKKGNKSRKVHSAYAPPPPVPPPPAIQRSSKRNPTQSNMGRPPLSTAATSILCNENVDNNGRQSPLITGMPPLPPPPPLKILETKMTVKRDFVRIQSNQSSRCGSPEADETELVSSTGKTNGSEGGGVGVFCPSPDVNMKADSFIARLRDGWRLEKMNSLREKQKTRI